MSNINFQNNQDWIITTLRKKSNIKKKQIQIDPTFKKMNNLDNATETIIIKDLLFSLSVENTVLVLERLLKIKNIFPTIKAEKLIALVSNSEWPSLMVNKKTAKTNANNNKPCKTLSAILFRPKKVSLRFLGFLIIMSFSSFSDSKAIEQTGSIINSKNTI